VHDLSRIAREPSQTAHDPSQTAHNPSQTAHDPSQTAHDPSQTAHEPPAGVFHSAEISSLPVFIVLLQESTKEELRK